MYNVGIIYLDGRFSKQRQSGLKGQEMLLLQSKLAKYVDNVQIITYKDDFNIFDTLIMFGVSYNQWGGQVVIPQLETYKKLNKFKGNLYFWFEDSRFPFKQFTDELNKAKWWTKSDCFISSEEFIITQPINILSMFDEHTTRELHSKYVFNLKDIFQIDVCLTHLDNRKCRSVPFKNKEVDLIYGGVNKKKKLNKFYKEFFFDRQNITSELYGSLSKDIKDINVGKTQISDKIPYSDVLQKNSTGLCTIIPYQKGYEYTVTPRVLEALMSNIICFIQKGFDREHNIFNDDFFYVNNGEELENKIIMLKNNIKLYNSKLLTQTEVLNKYISKDIGEEIFNIIRKDIL